jgi:DNA-binding transcriptional regulator YhcF (GntR family)
MTTGEAKTIGELLKQIHVQQINSAGQVMSQRELADWFGIDRIVFNKYYNDLRIPEGENLEKIARKAGPIAYRLAGQLPPELQYEIDQVPPEKLHEIKEMISQYLTDRGYKRLD